MIAPPSKPLRREPLRREPLRRENGGPVPFGTHEDAILALLLAQDGSTTNLLERIGQCKISVHLVEQQVVDKLPIQIDGELPGHRFLRRITSLHSGGLVLLDSIAYIATDVLPPPVVKALEDGTRPIGHVLSPLWTRRSFRDRNGPLLEDLWKAVGQPDPHASRSLCIYTPRAPCVLLGETFRRGVLNFAFGAPVIRRVGERQQTRRTSPS